MTIRKRLQLIGLLPIILLFLLSSYFLVTSYIKFENANALKSVLKNNALLNDTLVNLSKERDLTALYLGSNKKEFTSSLHKQRLHLDTSIQTLQEKINSQSPYFFPTLMHLLENESETSSHSKTETLLQNVSSLPTMRKNINTKPVTFEEIFFDYYTKQLTTPTLKNLYQIQNYALNTEISSLISSLIQFYTAQEYSGLERGFISYYLIKRAPINFKQIALWNNFKTKANIYDVELVHNSTLQKELKDLLESTHTKEIMKQLAISTSKIESSISNAHYKESPLHWFTLQTNKITLLSKAQLIISNTLWKKSDGYLQKQLLLLIVAALIWLLSVIVGYINYKTAKDIAQNIQSLERVLNKAVEEAKETDVKLNPLLSSIKNIELDTQKGQKEAYHFLEILIQSAKEDQRIALKANEAKSQFLANMSHEIRTPLNGIVGFTEILRSTKLNEEQSEFLSIIDQSSENLLNIINKILDLSKMENHKIEIENIVFDAHTIFGNTIDTYAVSTANKNIDLNFYMDPNISKNLKGDATKIQEILINLLSNATKFTNYGGEINLEITKVDNNENLIHFLVKDNGIGMSEEQQSHIFDAFTQADVTVTRKYGGTGLGLTISSKFVEILGGKLEVQSIKDQGTSFYFTLPLEEIQSSIPEDPNLFESLTLGQYAPETTTTQDIYLEKYFNHFGPHIEYFDTIKQFHDLEKENHCKSYWIDIDKAPENIRDIITHIDKSKIIVIANVTSRQKLESLGIPQSNVLYKPVTLTKFKNTLEYISSNKIITQSPIEIQQTTFDAHILITEDNLINQRLIQRILQTYGIQADLANNGLEAFEKRRSKNYDLIFMDIQMPVMDGIEATQEILDYEEDEQLPHIPIVALTANALKGDREKFLEQGMDEYIAKPIETAELLYILNKFLSSHAHTSIEKIANTTPIPFDNNQKDIEQVPKVEHLALSDTSNKKLDLMMSQEDDVIDNTPIALEENSTQKETLPSNKKHILIAKKLILEQKVLEKVLTNLGETYTIADLHMPLKDTLRKNEFDILFVDDISTIEDITSAFPSLLIINNTVSKDEIEVLLSQKRG